MSRLAVQSIQQYHTQCHYHHKYFSQQIFTIYDYQAQVINLIADQAAVKIKSKLLLSKYWHSSIFQSKGFNFSNIMLRNLSYPPLF